MTTDAAHPGQPLAGPHAAHPLWCPPWCEVDPAVGGFHHSARTWVDRDGVTGDERGIGIAVRGYDHPGQGVHVTQLDLGAMVWTPGRGRSRGQRLVSVASLSAQGVRALVSELRRHEQVMTGEVGSATWW